MCTLFSPHIVAYRPSLYTTLAPYILADTDNEMSHVLVFSVCVLYSCTIREHLIDHIYYIVLCNIDTLVADYNSTPAKAQIQYKTDTMKTEKKSRLRRVLEAVFSTDTVYITVYIIIIMCACRRWVNSRARKGDFFTQKGLNLMAGQIDTEILFIVSFIKSLFMRHVRACACRRLICVNTHPHHPYYPPPKKQADSCA